MIPRRFITEWSARAPWPENAQIEQDLVIEKALLQIFSAPFLSERLAFRGGTALHKLWLKPPVRYPEDIALVQISPEPIKETLSALRKQLSFLGNPTVKQSAHNNSLLFRFESEVPPIISLRLKIEINCREHFSVLGFQEKDHTAESTWLDGSCKITTYALAEMLGTKLRALYQRKKGRDLFDLYYAMTYLNPDSETIVKCYRKYMTTSATSLPTRKQYLLNLDEKLDDPDFTGDMHALLRPGVEYDPLIALELIKAELIERI